MAKRSFVRVWIRRAVLLALWTVFLIVATLLGVEALRVRSMPALARWHERAPASEFKAKDAVPGFDFARYLEREEAVFRELSPFFLQGDEAQGISPVFRFVAGGPGDPSTFSPNWNRTQILEPAGAPIGGALLLHGLTDSPYSMRSTAQMLRDAGFLCICLRYPGHGTVPGALLQADWEDWYAASRIAWNELRRRVDADRPCILCGYSTGGAISVLLTLELLEQGAPPPSRLILFSPAIGITPFAVASNLHRLYSWIPFYEKTRWLSIEPEYDPFKYNSFPQHAGAQSWGLTGRLSEEIERAAQDGRLARLPPILSFQSLVDSTIVARDLITRLYDRLPANGSEIVCFDVNRGRMLEGFLSQSVPDIAARLADPRRAYGLTLVTNIEPGSRQVEAREQAAGAAELRTRPLETPWPPQVFSLAHVAIPFPPDDPLYGDGRGDATGRLPIGDLSMRGERGVLAMSADDLMRLRHNPFHAYMMEWIRREIGAR